jgi:Leucine-rich repeat (LRR) protein
MVYVQHARQVIVCSLLVLLSLVVPFVASFFVYPTDDPGDTSVLFDLFTAFRGDSTWYSTRKWFINGTSFCSWGGITCECVRSPRCRVLTIDLGSSMKITGSLDDSGRYVPDSIGNLTWLQSLKLQRNYIGSTIPASIGELRNLTYLDVSSNNFKGSFPTSIRFCTKLTYFNCVFNRFTGFPSELGLLPNLRTLDISSNTALASPPQLVTCPPGLQTLRFRSLDYSMYVHSANMSWISQCTALTRIEISGLTGPFPDWFGRSLSTLTFVNVVYNYFTGSLPRSICQLNRLTSLRISLSSMSGELPDCFDNMTQLTSFDIQSNQFSSTIPSSIGRLPLLSSVYLNSNNFEGSIPASFAGLKNLMNFQVNLNRLNGTLDIISNMTLISFDVSSNQFTGTIPSSMRLLWECILSDNRLTGTLPPYLFQNASALTTFKVSNNFIFGELPESIPTTLSVLNVDNNLLTGTLPRWFCDLNSFSTMFSVAQNRISGTIPSCFGEKKAVVLHVLNFSMNMISGTIPEHIGNLNNVTLNFVDFRNNLLQGTIPASFARLTSLLFLDLSFNKFSGTFPSILTQLPALSRLDIAGNLFSFSLDTLFSEAKYLPAYVNVSHNQFLGQVTMLRGNCVGNANQSSTCLQVSILDARSNSFDCPFPGYDQNQILFLRDSCSPPYITFAIYVGSLAGLVLVASIIRYLVLKQFGLVSIAEPSYAPSNWRWLLFVLSYLSSILTLASDGYTIYTIMIYLLSRIDNCEFVNGYQVWKTLPILVDTFDFSETTYSGMTFAQYVYRYITTVNQNHLGVADMAVFNPFDIINVDIISSQVSQFAATCYSIQSGCSVRYSQQFPSPFANECYMEFDQEAPFGGTSHRIFFYNFIAIICVRCLVEFSKIGLVLVSCVRREIIARTWSIDFVGISLFTPLWIVPVGSSWSEFFKTIVMHQATHTELIWRLVHHSLLCSIPLLCANLYFLFAVSQSGLQLLNMFSVMSACVTIPLNIIRAVQAWRATDRTFTTDDMTNVLQMSETAVDVNSIKLDGFTANQQI